MTDEIASEILCSLCGEVCKRGAQLKCCGVRACRACAVVRINRDRKCWNEECGKQVNSTDDLINDYVLRKAVEYFNSNGKMNPEHEKLLKKINEDLSKANKKKSEKTVTVAEKFEQPCRRGNNCKLKGKACLFNHDHDDDPKPEKEKNDSEENGTNDGSSPAKTKGKREKTWTTVAEKFEQPCGRGNRCKLKGKACLFNHDNDDETDSKKPCKFGTWCTIPDCKFDHVYVTKVNKPCNFGNKCIKSDCKYMHGNEAVWHMMARMRGWGRPMGPRSMGGPMTGRGYDVERYMAMQGMRDDLENMMDNLAGGGWGSYGGPIGDGGGYRKSNRH